MLPSHINNSNSWHLFQEPPHTILKREFSPIHNCSNLGTIQVPKHRRLGKETMKLHTNYKNIHKKTYNVYIQKYKMKNYSPKMVKFGLKQQKSRWGTILGCVWPRFNCNTTYGPLLEKKQQFILFIFKFLFSFSDKFRGQFLV